MATMMGGGGGDDDPVGELGRRGDDAAGERRGPRRVGGGAGCAVAGSRTEPVDLLHPESLDDGGLLMVLHQAASAPGFPAWFPAGVALVGWGAGLAVRLAQGGMFPDRYGPKEEKMESVLQGFDKAHFKQKACDSA